MIVPTHVNLFGPIPGDGLLVRPGINIVFPWGFLTALTANTKQFKFDLLYPSLEHARWMIIWGSSYPDAEARLIHMDDGPLNITEISRVTNDGSGHPRIGEADITAALNTLITGATKKHIGFQLNGSQQMVIYEVRLELNWRL